MNSGSAQVCVSPEHAAQTGLGYVCSTKKIPLLLLLTSNEV